MTSTIFEEGEKAMKVQTNHGSKNMTPESWVRRYRRLEMTTRGCGYPILIAAFIYAFLCVYVFHTPQMILPISIFASAAIAIPIGMQLSFVYNTRYILDVDQDPDRYAEVLKMALPVAHWFQSGWIRTEQARAEIARGDTKEAKAILMSEAMQHGMSQFYTLRRLELLGICAILEDDEKEMSECVDRLAAGVKNGLPFCGCGGNGKAIAASIENNWKNVKAETRAD